MFEGSIEESVPVNGAEIFVRYGTTFAEEAPDELSSALSDFRSGDASPLPAVSACGA